jgi:hypothetical protein
MADDKKDCRDTLSALQDASTIASRINKINKIANATEDAVLKKALVSLSGEFARARSVAKKDQTDTLNQAKFKKLIDYCQKQIDSAEPQWQILARRAGWTPPAA